MRKIALAVCFLLAALSAVPQNDSSRLDAGSLVLKRNFTQHIAIKGADLEKMPFTNLTDAINVWISGAYTVNRSLIYVVDGNIVNDVNAYSIHDIEEVVFVQNASVLTATAIGQQEMVLITTHNASRQGSDRPSARASSQTFLVHSPGAMTEAYYHNYAGVDARFSKITLGISGDWLQDALPMVKQKDFTSMQDFTMDRWRLNGNFGWQPDAKNYVEVHVGFTPQKLDSARSYALQGQGPPRYNERSDESDKQFNSWARWRGEWLPGLRNDLQAGYLHFTQTADYNYLGQTFTGPQDTTGTNFNSETAGAFHIHHIYVRDRLSYAMHAGDWSIEPSINASYQSLKQAYVQASVSQSGSVSGGGGGLGTTVSNMVAGQGQKFSLFVLTPALDISYRQVLNIQGGVVTNVTHNGGGAGAILPRTVGFGSIAIDVFRLAGLNPAASLKLFGSYAQRSSFTATAFSLNDIDNSNGPFKFPVSFSGFQPVLGSYYSGTLGPITGVIALSVPRYWVWEAGARWSMLKDRFGIEYNFQRRNFSTIYSSAAGGFLTYYYADWHSSQHRIAIDGRLIDGADLSWRSGLNTTVMRCKIGSNYQDIPTDGIVGDHFPGNTKPSFTGGWTNRVQYHQFGLGFDLLYHFNGENITANNFGALSAFSRDNAWLAQNIYIAYKVAMPENIGLELYLDSRGLVRGGNTANLTTPSRYYGLGGKISF
ncbi:MAG TPA: hypothetical protein VGM31_07450 [Puia sp.]|jgi:hypothetical protein